MENRSEVLKKIRPLIPKARIETGISEEEHFQNKVLRPIIKFQHELLIERFKQQLIKRKIDFSDLAENEKIKKINTIFETDTNFKIELKGIIIALLTKEEYQEYAKNASVLNRRINNIIQERILKSIDVLEK